MRSRENTYMQLRDESLLDHRELPLKKMRCKCGTLRTAAWSEKGEKESIGRTYAAGVKL
jgi:hypothetical protein